MQAHASRQISMILIGCALLGGSLGCTDIAGGDTGGDTTGDDTGDGDGDAASAYAGAATCFSCHEITYARWRVTRHADALETLRAIGQHENEYCVGCHSVGYGEVGGFVDELSTSHLAGVQCENCHGPAAAHAAAPNDAELRPPLELASDLCGGCHSDAHHPTYEEWQQSKHSMALGNLAALPYAQDECLGCHSQDYRYAEERGEPLPTLDSAELSIECSTCHSAHSSANQPSQLRAPVAQLCGGCHTVEDSKLGESPHHPQIEMLSGAGAFTDGGGSLEQLGPHSGLVNAEGGEACAQCHVVQAAVEEPNEGNPNVTGHTFNPFDLDIVNYSPDDRYSGCRLCHSVTDAEMLKSGVQAEIDVRLQTLAPYFDDQSPSYVDPDGLSDLDKSRLAVALYNYEFVSADGSTGVHNSEYARAALDIADAVLLDLVP